MFQFDTHVLFVCHLAKIVRFKETESHHARHGSKKNIETNVPLTRRAFYSFLSTEEQCHVNFAFLNIFFEISYSSIRCILAIVKQSHLSLSRVFPCYSH